MHYEYEGVLMTKQDLFKKRIYEVIEASKAEDIASSAYDIMIFFAVIVGLIPLTMKTSNVYTRLIDLVTVIIFLVDYLLRLYTSDYKMGVKSYKAYIAYGFTPMAIVDLLSIVPILSFVFPSKTVIGLFRVFRVFRVFKLTRYFKTMVTITNVLRKVKKQLFSVLVLTVSYILATAMLIFQIEPDKFGTFFDAVYWSTISITTIGYGDISPDTQIGRLITILSALVGVAVIALPSGIITAAYMEEIKRKKGKHEL